MAVVDSSALIPLAWVGRLDLLEAVFEDLRTVEAVREEVVTAGKPGTAALEQFLDDVAIHEVPADASEVASMEGIEPTDAGVVLLADERDCPLVANDKGLISVARSHGVDCVWVTSVLLRATNADVLSSEEASRVCYDLVDEGMNLHPKVYSRVQKALDELGE